MSEPAQRRLIHRVAAIFAASVAVCGSALAVDPMAVDVLDDLPPTTRVLIRTAPDTTL